MSAFGRLLLVYFALMCLLMAGIFMLANILGG